MYLLDYNNFLYEFNSNKLNLLTKNKISNSFTISFEIEMECNDNKIPLNFHEIDLINELRNKLYSVLKSENIDFKERLFFIEELTNNCDFKDIIFTNDEILNLENYNDKLDINIVKNANIIYNDIINRIDKKKIISDNDKLNYFITKVEKYLPKLYNKYKDNLDFVLDTTLYRCVEIKQKTYIIGINDSIHFINDFFEEFNNQEYWKFTHKTGLHINIGIIKDDIKWNIVKGMMILKDFGSDIPFVYKDMVYRINTSFTSSIFDHLELQKEKINLKDINKTEKYINNEIEKIFKKIGPKHFGFNIDKIKKNNYVEFRYIGGNVNKDMVINKLLYFCYVVYSMTDYNYDRKKYLKNLYKYFDGLI